MRKNQQLHDRLIKIIVTFVSTALRFNGRSLIILGIENEFEIKRKTWNLQQNK